MCVYIYNAHTQRHRWIRQMYLHSLYLQTRTHTNASTEKMKTHPHKEQDIGSSCEKWSRDDINNRMALSQCRTQLHLNSTCNSLERLEVDTLSLCTEGPFREGTQGGLKKLGGSQRYCYRPKNWSGNARWFSLVAHWLPVAVWQAMRVASPQKLNYFFPLCNNKKLPGHKTTHPIWMLGLAGVYNSFVLFVLPFLSYIIFAIAAWMTRCSLPCH